MVSEDEGPEKLDWRGNFRCLSTSSDHAADLKTLATRPHARQQKERTVGKTLVVWLWPL